MGNLMDELKLTAQALYCEKVENLTPSQLHMALGKVVQAEIAENWAKSKKKHDSGRRAFYFSAEFLMGRMMYNNLYCLGILDETKAMLKKKGIDLEDYLQEKLLTPLGISGTRWMRDPHDICTGGFGFSCKSFLKPLP